MDLLKVEDYLRPLSLPEEYKGLILTFLGLLDQSFSSRNLVLSTPYIQPAEDKEDFHIWWDTEDKYLDVLINPFGKKDWLFRDWVNGKAAIGKALGTEEDRVVFLPDTFFEKLILFCSHKEA